MGAMTKEAYDADRAAERRADRRALIALVFGSFAFLLVNVFSIQTERARSGLEAWTPHPWILEGSSMVMILALLPLIMIITRRAPIRDVSWRVWLPVHFAASIVFSLVHIFGMVALRKLLFPILTLEEYVFFGDVARELIYEYRKDVLTYSLAVFFITVSRHVAQLQLEAAGMRAEAMETKRLTLKCGGRTMRVDAADIVWAKAASNYVELRAGARTLLARATLASIEDQLVEAGVAAVRVHRSFIVNADAITEIEPTGEGDVRITMRDGEIIPGSRRYRARLPAA